MIQHFRQVLDDIQKEAEDLFASRKVILQKAFNAHRQGDYELSIPVMLAQAEGIYLDIFGIFEPSPYKLGKKHFKNKIERKLNSPLAKLFNDYFFCVADELSIKKSTKLATSPFPLSRNLVLHGISTDYATEVNALKTVSWLQYIISFKEAAEHKITGSEQPKSY